MSERTDHIDMRRLELPIDGEYQRWCSPGPEKDAITNFLGKLRRDIAATAGVPLANIAVMLYSHGDQDSQQGKQGLLDPSLWRLVAYRNVWNTAPVHGPMFREPGKDIYSLVKADLGKLVEVREGGLDTDSEHGFASRERVRYRYAQEIRHIEDAPNTSPRTLGLLFVNFCQNGSADELFKEFTESSKGRVRQALERFINAEKLKELAHCCALHGDSLLRDGRLPLLAREYAFVSQGRYQDELDRRSTDSSSAQEVRHEDVEKRHRDALAEVLRDLLGRIAQILIEKRKKEKEEQEEDRGWADRNNLAVWGSVRVAEIDNDSRAEQKAAVYGAWTRASFHSRDNQRNETSKGGVDSLGRFLELPPAVLLSPDDKWKGRNEWPGMGLIAWSQRYKRPVIVSDLSEDGDRCTKEAWSKVYQHTFYGDNESEYPEHLRFPTNSEIVVPIEIETGDIWGVLNLESNVPKFFLPEDVDFLFVCARLLGLLIHEHLQRLMDEHTTMILQQFIERGEGGNASSDSLARDGGKTAPPQSNLTLPRQMAQLLQQHLSASEVTVTPWGGGLWPISEAAIAPAANSAGDGRAQSKRLSRKLVDDKEMSVPDGLLIRTQDVMKGIWLNQSPQEGECYQQTYFHVTLSSRRVPAPEQGQQAPWPVVKTTDDKPYKTLIGVPILIPAAQRESPGNGKAQHIAAVCWIKYEAFVPFFKIKAREIAQLVRLLSIYLWHHRAARTVSDPSLGGIVFNRDALEDYLVRSREPGAVCAQAATLIDMDDLRGINSRRGYADATKVLQRFLRLMVDTCSEIQKAFNAEEERKAQAASKANGRYSPRSLHADIFKYGGDEFVLMLRLGQPKEPSSEQKPDEEEAEEWLDKWDQAFRAKLRDANTPNSDGEDPGFQQIWVDEKPSFSCGATIHLPKLLDDFESYFSKIREKPPPLNVAVVRWVLAHLGACLRVAKHLGKGKMVRYDDGAKRDRGVKRLVCASLYEYYPKQSRQEAQAESGSPPEAREVDAKAGAVPGDGKDEALTRRPLRIKAVLSRSQIILPVGTEHGVRPKMRFQVVTNVGKYKGKNPQKGKSPQKQQPVFDPRTKAEIEIIEVWDNVCLAQVLSSNGALKRKDPVILKRE